MKKFGETPPQREELESKISLEKARQLKPLEVDKVKAFLTYFARKKYENGQEKTSFSTRS